MREHEIINQRIKRIEGENTTMINSVIDAAVSEMLKENSETTANKLSEYILKNKPLEVLTAIYTLAMTCSGLLPESLQSIEMREKVTMKVITEVFADSKCGDGVKWRTNEEKLEGKYVSWLEESIRVRGGDPSNDNIQTRDIGDPEGCHIDFDAILCELLKELGFDKVVRTYNKTGKLYA
jgi:hypothetical protein